MKIIEIKTTQNVVLQYELADLRDRVFAFLIDFGSLVLGLSILINIAESTLTGTARDVIIMGLMCVFIFYSLAMETLNNGQSLGKMALRIQVIKTTSGRPRFADFAARWAFRLVDIYFSLGGIASIMISSSSKAQRIGDIVANTAIIKLAPKMHLNLEDILTMHANSNYTPEYTQARQLREEDAVLIKNTLDRYRLFRNPAHRDALIMLADEITTILNIDQKPPDTQRFLETVLRDYVVLTR